MSSLVISPPSTALDNMVRDSLFNTVPGSVRDASERYRRNVLETLCTMKLPSNSKVQVNAKFAEQSTEVVHDWAPETKTINTSDDRSLKNHEMQHKSENANDQVKKKPKTNGGSAVLSSNDGKFLDAIAIFAAGVGTVLVAMGTESPTLTSACAGFTASLAYKYYKRYLRSGDKVDYDKPLCTDVTELSDSAIDGLLCGLTVNVPLIGITALGVKYYLMDDTFSSSVDSFATSGVKAGLRKLSESAFSNPMWIVLPVLALTVRRLLQKESDESEYRSTSASSITSTRSRVKWFRSIS